MMRKKLLAPRAYEYKAKAEPNSCVSKQKFITGFYFFSFSICELARVAENI